MSFNDRQNLGTFNMTAFQESFYMSQKDNHPSPSIDPINQLDLTATSQIFGCKFCKYLKNITSEVTVSFSGQGKFCES